MNDTMNLIGGPARAFAAGVKAADENPAGVASGSAAQHAMEAVKANQVAREAGAEADRLSRKLRRLLERVERATELVDRGWGSEARDELRRAIQEAKQP